MDANVHANVYIYRWDDASVNLNATRLARRIASPVRGMPGKQLADESIDPREAADMELNARADGREVDT